MLNATSKKREVLPKPQGPQGGADLRFISPQPDTSLHRQTIARCACLRPSFRWYSLRPPTKGWPGWVDLGGWLHTKMVYPPADGHQSQY